MSTTNNNNQPSNIRTPSQDGQGPWYDLLSPTQVRTGQPNVNNKTKWQQKKKNKCRGNRKAQHQRRRLRRQQGNMNNNNNHHHHHPNREQAAASQVQQQPNNQHRQKYKNKRKRQDTNQDDRHIDRSLSQLSISQQRNAKKRKTTTTTTTHRNNQSASARSPPTTTTMMIDNNHQEREEEEEEEEQQEADNDLSSNCLQKFQPKYLKVSDPIFQQMLSNSIPDGDKIVSCLDTYQKLQFVRRMTEVTNNLEYFALQKHLWQYYKNLGTQENIWTTESSNSTTTNQRKPYFFPKHLIEQRLHTIAHQIQRTSNELKHCYLDLERNIQQWYPSIDINLLSKAMMECVKKGQQRLRQEFQYKQDITTLDLKDRCAITKFYQLKPNEKQIDLTKKYWQTVANELRITAEIEKLRKRIYLQRLPSKLNKLIDQSLDHSQLMLGNSVLDKDQRAGLTSSYSKTITQYKFDLMSLNLDTMEHIRRGHQQQLLDLQEQLLQSCDDLLKQAIDNRRQTMVTRHEKFLEHTLDTFFDEAPTVTSNE